MPVTHLTPSTYRHMPWKNGLGVTIEIARSPQQGDFDWRVSVARIDRDGPFSTFPGCDRVIVALDGAGMILTHPDTAAALAALEPWRFRGEWTTTCVLRGGAIRDFNVITRRDVFSAEVSILVLDAPHSLELAAATTILYCVSGHALADATPVAPDDTIIIEGAERLSIRPAGDRATLIRAEVSLSNG